VGILNTIKNDCFLQGPSREMSGIHPPKARERGVEGNGDRSPGREKSSCTLRVRTPFFPKASKVQSIAKGVMGNESRQGVANKFPYQGPHIFRGLVVRSMRKENW